MSEYVTTAPTPIARIIDGHPVPYSLTVEPGDRSDLTTDEVRRAAERWLAESKPQMRIVRIDGHYVYYDYALDAMRAARGPQEMNHEHR